MKIKKITYIVICITVLCFCNVALHGYGSEYNYPLKESCLGILLDDGLILKSLLDEMPIIDASELSELTRDIFQKLTNGKFVVEGFTLLKTLPGFEHVNSIAELHKINPSIASLELSFLPLLKEIPSVFQEPSEEWAISHINEEGLTYMNYDGQSKFFSFKDEYKGNMKELLKEMTIKYFLTHWIDSFTTASINVLDRDNVKRDRMFEWLGRELMQRHNIDMDETAERIIDICNFQNVYPNTIEAFKTTLIMFSMIESCPEFIFDITSTNEWYWFPQENGIVFCDKRTQELYSVNYKEGIETDDILRQMRDSFDILMMLPGNNLMNTIDSALLLNNTHLTTYDEARKRIKREHGDSVPYAYIDYVSYKGTFDFGKIPMQESYNRKMTLQELMILETTLSIAPPLLLGTKDIFFSFRPRRGVRIAYNFQTPYHWAGKKYSTYTMYPLDMRDANRLLVRVTNDRFAAEIEEYFTSDELIIIAYMASIIHEKIHRVWSHLSYDEQCRWAQISHAKRENVDNDAIVNKKYAAETRDATQTPDNHFLIRYIGERSPEEDFTEHSIFYVLFGGLFQKYAEGKNPLVEKYNFFKEILGDDDILGNFEELREVIRKMDDSNQEERETRVLEENESMEEPVLAAA
ncbi:hypothetical protein ACFL3D_03085 [Candidatus Omnitrophota bacterium]